MQAREDKPEHESRPARGDALPQASAIAVPTTRNAMMQRGHELCEELCIREGGLDKEFVAVEMEGFFLGEVMSEGPYRVEEATRGGGAGRKHPPLPLNAAHYIFRAARGAGAAGKGSRGAPPPCGKKKGVQLWEA